MGFLLDGSGERGVQVVPREDGPQVTSASYQAFVLYVYQYLMFCEYIKFIVKEQANLNWYYTARMIGGVLTSLDGKSSLS